MKYCFASNMTTQDDEEDPSRQDRPLSRHDIAVELARLFRNAQDDKVKLRCLELALDVCAELQPGDTVEPDPTERNYAFAYAKARKIAQGLGIAREEPRSP